VRRLTLCLALVLAACGGSDGTTLEGARIDSTNIRLSVGEARYIGLTGLKATNGKATLLSLRVEGPRDMEASVLLIDLSRSPAVVAGAVIDRTAEVEVIGAVIDDGRPRYSPTLAVRPRARGTHRLTAVVAEYRVGGSTKAKSQRIPINVTVTAD